MTNTNTHQPPPQTATPALVRALQRAVDGEVRFDRGSQALYATDASNYRQTPLGVVLPRTVEALERAVAVCREYDVAVLNRGGGTSTAGQCCNTAVVIDTSKYLNQVLELNPEERYARVQPGTVLDELRQQAEAHGLTFGPDPATHSRCTLGGMIGNNSCGVHSIVSRTTEYNVESMEVLTYDGLRMTVGPTSGAELERIVDQGGRRGEIHRALRQIRDRYGALIRKRYPQIPRRVSGYNLNQLLPENDFNLARALVGTEGTCVTLLEATVRLMPSPPHRVLLVVGYADAPSAADHVPQILEAGPIGLEGIDNTLVQVMRRRHMLERNLDLLPKGGGWLLVEFGGETRAEASQAAGRLAERLRKGKASPETRVIEEPTEQRLIWKVRESALAATSHQDGQAATWEGWEDSAVAPERLGDYLRDLQHLMDSYGYSGAFYGHYGDGCVHSRMNFDLRTAHGITKWRRFLDDAAELVVRYGGSLSGEHGDGQARADLLPKMYGAELVQAFREFKAAWDPKGRMNPGKVVDPYSPIDNLRLGTDYTPAHSATYFQFPEDRHSFANATLRCVGVGSCRDTRSGTMCPSYMATGEEMHSTRGRARLLFEMLRGDPLQGGWHDPHVKQALDLCLACKACKSECPVNVDMATYKAEFMAHYYAKRFRPLRAHALGSLHEVSRVAGKVPRLANAVSNLRLTHHLLGTDPGKPLPRYAKRPFRDEFRPRGNGAVGDRPPVMLWPDTFNNHFRPGVCHDAVQILEAAGYQVMIPEQPLCCGRTLYDFGFLARARHKLLKILDALRPQIRSGIPLVGLEPSCMAVFRDELLNLFPNDEDAKRLSSQSHLLTEFLGDRPGALGDTALHGRALIQGHCHQKSIFGPDCGAGLLRDLGLDCEVLDAGCCGQAGSFGYEHPELSQRIAERGLVPAVERAGDETVLVADGFSCGEQIAALTGRRVVHTAELLARTLGGD